MRLFIVKRNDTTDYDECIEQTILATSEKEALDLASREYGSWYIFEEVAMSKSRVLTQHYIWG